MKRHVLLYILGLLGAVLPGVKFVAWPEPNYGFMVSIQDAEGYRYRYIHINNNTPGTDDGTAVAPVAAPQLSNELLPFGEFTGGTHIAVGNLDGRRASIREIQIL